MQVFLRRLAGAADENNGSLSERECGTAYMTVKITGEGSSPAILFDRNEVRNSVLMETSLSQQIIMKTHIQ